MKDFATIKARLHQLAEKKYQFIWDEEHDMTFNKVKSIVTNSVELSLLDYNYPYKSNIGSALIQEVNGEKKVSIIVPYDQQYRKTPHCYFDEYGNQEKISSIYNYFEVLDLKNRFQFSRVFITLL